MRKLILYIATSLDGYIAKQDNDLDFLKIVEKEGEDYGYAEFIANTDTIILGGKNICCDGGAEIVNELLNSDLIDEFIISVVTILVGNGIKLFKDGRPEQQLELVNVKTFGTGLTQLHYKQKKKR